MNYRSQVEDWMAEAFGEECGYPDECYELIFEHECKSRSVMADMSDDELIELYNQQSYIFTFANLEARIDRRMMGQCATCAVRLGDRIKLGNVDKTKTLTENFSTVMALYERARWSPEQIDDANPSEMSDADYVISHALEVLHDKIPKGDEWS